MNLRAPIAIGNTANIYHCKNETKVIKVFHDHLADGEAAKEAYKQKFAYDCGLPVPKIMEVTNVNGKQAIMMEYVKGKTLGDLLSENKQQAEHYMNLSVDIQRKIHGMAADSLEHMSEKLSRQIGAASYLDTGQKAALLKKLHGMEYDKKLCHGDFHLYNLIMSGDKVTIIDWVDSSAGDIRADVYRTYLLYTQFSMDLAELYLRLYCDKSGMSREEIFEWAPIIAGARLAGDVSAEKPERLLEIVHHNL